jgi:hypothetical protein
MEPGLFFKMKKGQHISSTMYRDQVLMRPLNDFWTESFLNIEEP